MSCTVTIPFHKELLDKLAKGVNLLDPHGEIVGSPYRRSTSSNLAKNSNDYTLHWEGCYELELPQEEDF